MGKQCVPGDSREVGACNTKGCGIERFCTWGDWTAYTECSAACGPGTQERSRELKVVSEEPEEPIDSSILAAMTDQVEAEPSYSQSLFASSAGFAAVLAASAFVKRGPRRYAVAPSSETD
jgi:hypothetical protein